MSKDKDISTWSRHTAVLRNLGLFLELVLLHGHTHTYTHQCVPTCIHRYMSVCVHWKAHGNHWLSLKS